MNIELTHKLTYKLSWFLVLCLSLPLYSAKKRSLYRRSFNPETAEQLLASLVIKPRLTDQEWKNLLTAKLKQKRGLASGGIDRPHRVISGESLWKISRKNLGSPWYWPKIWASNPNIQNPHEIEIGRLLAYYKESVDPTITIPLLKLVPSGNGKATSIDNDIIINPQLKNRYRPSIAILTDDISPVGEIRGSYTERAVMYVHENVYVEPIGGGEIAEGKKYAVVRKQRTLRSGPLLTSPIIGELVKVQGEIKIIRVEENLAVAEVETLTGTMNRGDLVIPSQGFIDLGIVTSDPPDDLNLSIIQGEEEDYTLLGQGQVVVVDKGEEDGLKAGHKFRVYRDTDPVTQKTSDVSPSFKGEVKIIFASKNAGLGIILRNEDPILIGDTLMPAQKFANRPTAPKRPVSILEFD